MKRRRRENCTLPKAKNNFTLFNAPHLRSREINIPNKFKQIILNANYRRVYSVDTSFLHEILFENCTVNWYISIYPIPLPENSNSTLFDK